MIITPGDISTSVSKGVNELIFSVDDADQGFIFEMLRSKIYSDSIAAICREISSNSRDANREVMKGHVPVEIGFHEDHPLNGDSSLHVYFKDSGPGISPDRMANVFCKYAKSTKRDDDEQTGGFGLGAKTPFAYTDAFNIITTVDGIEYTYTAYIDESRRGKIAKLNEAATTDSNGTIITVPIRPHDRHKFEKEIFKYTCLWDVTPKYVNFVNVTTTNLPSTAMSLPLANGMTARLMENSDWLFGKSHGMIVDGIPYDCDTRQVDKYKDIGNNRIDSNITIIVTANTGQVDLSVNRETVNYTQVTIKYIEDFLDAMKPEMLAKVEQFVSTSKSYYEACIKAWAIVNDKGYEVNTNLDRWGTFAMKWLKRYCPNDIVKLFAYNGKEVNISPVSFKTKEFTVGYYSDNNNVAYKKVDFGLMFFYKRPLYLFDTKTKSVYRSEKILDSIPSGKVKEFILVKDRTIERPKNMNDKDWAQVEGNFLKDKAACDAAFDNMEIPITPYSSLALPSRAGVKTNKADIITVPSRQVSKTSTSSNMKNRLMQANVRVKRLSGPIDDDDMSLAHKTLYIVTQDMSKITELSDSSIKIALFIMFYYDMQMYVIPKRMECHFKDCLDLETAVAGLDMKVVQKMIDADNAVDTWRKVDEFGIMNIEFGNLKLKQMITELKTKTNRYLRMTSLNDMRKHDVLSTMSQKFDIKVDKKKPGIGEILVYLDTFHKNYPLLKDVDFRYINSTRVVKGEIERYIRLINEDNAKAKLAKPVMPAVPAAIPPVVNNNSSVQP